MPTPTFRHDVSYTPEQKALRIKRIRRKVTVETNGCWIFTGFGNRGGYGLIRCDNKLWHAHRLMYVLAKGSIAPGLFVCHSCDVRRCINPDHLWLGTSADNTRDAQAKGRIWGQSLTACKRGHALTEENVYLHGGRRHCKTCQVERERKHKEKKKAERRARGPRQRPIIKHPLHVMAIGETYVQPMPTKYFRRLVWNHAARNGKKYKIIRQGAGFAVTRIA